MSARFPVGSHTPTGSIDDGAWVELSICAPHVELFFEPFNERPGARRRREARAKAMVDATVRAAVAQASGSPTRSSTCIHCTAGGACRNQ